MSGPCTPWTDEEAITSCCADLSDTADLDLAISVASGLLWALSGRRFGGRCRAVVRPQNLSRSCAPGGHYGGDVRMDRWPNGCRRLARVRLAGYPVRAIEEVLLDGEVLDPAAYALWQDRYLVRLTENAVWPSCQYLERAASEAGTFEVTYIYGEDPPASGQYAAARLACQIAKACGGQECDLPANVSRVVRQGLQVTLDAARTLQGPLGLAEVDAFLVGYPSPRRRPAVVSPDTEPYPLLISTEPAPEPEGSGS